MTREEYREKYQQDVDANRSAEVIALEVLNNLNNGYVYEDVSDDARYYCKGDILMKKNGKVKKIDVKNEHRIADTGNFFVEANGWDKIHNCYKKGWIDCNYDYVAVVSQSEGIIWVLSFKCLKSVYNKTKLTTGRRVTSSHWDCDKCGYTIPIYKAIELGVVLAKITYEYDDWTEEYMPVEYISKADLQAA